MNFEVSVTICPDDYIIMIKDYTPGRPAPACCDPNSARYYDFGDDSEFNYDIVDCNYEPVTDEKEVAKVERWIADNIALIDDQAEKEMRFAS
jgi:hypothetical protein